MINAFQLVFPILRHVFHDDMFSLHVYVNFAKTLDIHVYPKSHLLFMQILLWTHLCFEHICIPLVLTKHTYTLM